VLQPSITGIFIFLTAALLAWPLGKYMAGVYKGEQYWLSHLERVENFFYKICRIDPATEMNWKQYLVSLLAINFIWLLFGVVILLFQGHLFLNPAHNPSMEWSLAINSAISFLTSTNVQHYSGETGATYLSQLAVFTFLQFLSAATSLAAGIALVRGLMHKSRECLGNFYRDFVRSLTRILLPLSIVAATLFLFSGMPMTFTGPQTVHTLQNDTIQVATGPVAAMIPIKELGSNGGGFFGANDAHPFENPDFFSFIIHCIIVLLIPIAFVVCIGYYINEKRFGRMIFIVMAIGLLLVTIPIIMQEVKGSPAISAMGVPNTSGNMEGKEVRFGSFYSAYYSGINMAIPAGTITGMHDSYMPLSGVYMLVGMHIDAFFGGLGSGWINMFFYLIVATFIASLMVGRSPEFFGKKIDSREMQLVVAVSVSQMFIPLLFTAIACVVYLHYPGGNGTLNWLSNKGPHGFTTMLYEYVSCFAGNGSEFSGLGNNTIFWNLTTAIVMLLGRYIPIVVAIMIGGFLLHKKYIPPTSGSLRTDSYTFGGFLLMTILVLNALSLFSVYILGPISEHFMF